MKNSNYDVIVVGCGVAGLSGALLLARSRRSVLVLDAGEPRNAPAHAAHNFLSRDGISPLALLQAGRAEVQGYGGHIARGRVRSAAKVGDAFEVALDDGSIMTARRLLVATGLVDELPNIPGLRERWGRDVLHCPYCHGWEVRDQAVGVLATEPRAVHMALLFRQLTSDVVLFTHTAPELSDEESEELAARDIRIIAGVVESIEVEDDRLSGVRLRDGTVVARQALVVTPRFVARSEVLRSLGVQPTPHPMGMGEFIPADATGRTVVPGVWVAGNVADLSAGLMAAAGSGATAAAALNADLVAEDTRQAVEARRVGRSGTLQRCAQHDGGLDPDALLTREYWDARYGSAEQIWSGNPNPQLVAQVADLSPGSVLDVGCGEGADAIWLAEHGWQVTAIDISSVALERAAKRAREAGHEVARRISWQQADVLTWDPAPRQFDLVSAQFMHLPRPARQALHRRLAAAVRPGGTLLIVGHHPADLETTVGRPHLPDFLYTPEDVAATLDAAEWNVTAATAPGRQSLDTEGRPVIVRDAIVRAVRRTPTTVASSDS
jgi:thioredoxin reductase/SAM-dependent methyltransferase